MKQSLVGGLEHEWIMTFHSVGNVIIPTDFHSIIFQRGRLNYQIKLSSFDLHPMLKPQLLRVVQWWLMEALMVRFYATPVGFFGEFLHHWPCNSKFGYLRNNLWHPKLSTIWFLKIGLPPKYEHFRWDLMMKHSHFFHSQAKVYWIDVSLKKIQRVWNSDDFFTVPWRGSSSPVPFSWALMPSASINGRWQSSQRAMWLICRRYSINWSPQVDVWILSLTQKCQGFSAI